MRAPPGLAEFCAREHPRLVGALILYGVDEDAANELAQEALIRACSHWKKVEMMASSQAWLTRVAINLANSFYRRRAAERRAHERLHNDRPLDVSGASEAFIAEPIRVAVAKLPKRQRTALIMRYYSDLSTHEVAEIMGCSESAVRRLTSHAIGSLRGNDRLKKLLEVHDV